MAWYRNAGSRVYHRAEDGWVRSGKAICGADISRPGFVARDQKDLENCRHRACKHCLRRDK